MGCCSNLSRCILFILNFVCFLIGLAMIIIGVVYEVNFAHLTNYLDDWTRAFQLVPILFIVIGCIIVIISFFGCCGAWRRSTCMLTTYAVILIIILIIQIAFVIFTFVQASNMSEWKADLVISLERLFDPTSTATNEAVDFIQETLQCCGVHIAPPIPPPSCCGGLDPCLFPFPDGCSDRLYEFLNNSIMIIGIVAVVLAAIEFVGVILALCITRRRGHKA
ncbi:hypothetical protein Trydic_g17694 [Trypoxylus dichotomus]